MAESEANQTTESLAQRDEGEKHLKYLEFVQSAVIYFIVCFSTVYEYAKENAGPLKPGVQTVENTVKTVIGPVYDRFQDVPLELLKFVDLKMADVARGHDGDGHGDPPPGGWQPHSGCLSSRGPRRRGDTKNKQLGALWEKNGHRPFPILFDLEDQTTIRPVGSMAKDFKSLLGVTVRSRVPYTYESWEKVPEVYKTAIWPQLQTFFDLSPYSTDGRVNTLIQDGVMRLAASLYPIGKSHFKSKYFMSQGGLDKAEEIRQQPPPNMSPQTWNELVDFYCRADNVHKSIVNSNNRAHHHYPSHHGTKAYVETRYERFQAMGQYPSLIEGFRDMHSRHGVIPLPAVAQQQYSSST